ncbi:gamma-glutamyltransferase family protein [Rhodococcus jostii]|uniref:Gamma-glutamyltranspeptidase / glutathione hydrolase n=1 Tax=Rhodococcus jostii TaxID=132919 RepID=A0A1H4IT11_RHOJO|nr:gamma-glutamyltransferase [Rhodococcus jostii]SEB37199.1 gamma-glutamyltranspeptidase / glutathione hydrolase [Rhodococcus jostii]
MSGAAVASPHYLATMAGADVLAGGGNAVDAAVATNLTLAVVTPYFCGVGGDLLAMVWDGSVHGYLGVGRSSEAAHIDHIQALPGPRSRVGGRTVTVPGAVQGWFDLLDRWGTWDFDAVARTAVANARSGLRVSSAARVRIERALESYPADSSVHEFCAEWRGDNTVRQQALAELLVSLGRCGPSHFYDGPVAGEIVHTVTDAGGILTADDLASHRGMWVDPLSCTYRGRQIFELPPPTQGTMALEALRLVEDDRRRSSAERSHQLVEAMKCALFDRDTTITDPARMTRSAQELISDIHIDRIRSEFDPDSARNPGAAVVQRGGTAAICATDSSGLSISLLQSNLMPLGSGVNVPNSGFVLHNRGASFSYDRDHVNAWAPSKLPMHTLAPGMIIDGSSPSLLFATMGADAQPQVHLQLLTALLDDGVNIASALARPRWSVEPGTWKVRVEADMDATVLAGLRGRGHDVEIVAPYSDMMGHAQLIDLSGTAVRAASDPRAEGLALVL